MDTRHLDEDCPHCRPVLMHPDTGLPRNDNAPEMVALLRVWAATSIEERRSFHRSYVDRSTAHEDLTVLRRLQYRYEDAFRNL